MAHFHFYESPLELKLAFSLMQGCKMAPKGKCNKIQTRKVQITKMIDGTKRTETLLIRYWGPDWVDLWWLELDETLERFDIWVSNVALESTCNTHVMALYKNISFFVFWRHFHNLRPFQFINPKKICFPANSCGTFVPYLLFRGASVCRMLRVQSREMCRKLSWNWSQVWSPAVHPASKSFNCSSLL